MTTEEFFKIVPARQFFNKYCPDVKRFYHKMRGIDGNKKALDFSADDKVKMKQAALRLAEDLKKVKF